MNPGILRHTITFQLQSGADSYNQPEDWDDVKTVKAAIYPTSGKELIAVESSGSEITHRIIIRKTDGLNPSMRVKFGSKYFQVLYIIEPQDFKRSGWFQVMCKELWPNG